LLALSRLPGNCPVFDRPCSLADSTQNITFESDKKITGKGEKRDQIDHILDTNEWQLRPRSAAGKLIVSRNAFKGGTRPMYRGMTALLNQQKELLKSFI
jgi:hypothetical protein